MDFTVRLPTKQFPALLVDYEGGKGSQFRLGNRLITEDTPVQMLVPGFTVRQLPEDAAAACRVPVDLLIVGSGRHHDLPRDWFRARQRRGGVGVGELGPQLAAALVEPDGAAREGVDRDAGERGRHGVGRRDLRHRPVKRGVPRGVLARVAGAAGARRHVAVLRRLNRPDRDRFFARPAIRARERRAGEAGRNGQRGGGKQQIFGVANAREWAHHAARSYSGGSEC